jgi:hypothetical protein
LIFLLDKLVIVIVGREGEKNEKKVVGSKRR